MCLASMNLKIIAQLSPTAVNLDIWPGRGFHPAPMPTTLQLSVKNSYLTTQISTNLDKGTHLTSDMGVYLMKHAYEMHAYEMYACEIYACKVHAHT